MKKRAVKASNSVITYTCVHTNGVRQPVCRRSTTITIFTTTSQCAHTVNYLHCWKAECMYSTSISHKFYCANKNLLCISLRYNFQVLYALQLYNCGCQKNGALAVFKPLCTQTMNFSTYPQQHSQAEKAHCITILLPQAQQSSSSLWDSKLPAYNL